MERQWIVVMSLDAVVCEGMGTKTVHAAPRFLNLIIACTINHF